MSDSNQPTGFIGRQHHNLRIGEDIGEVFIGRICLSRCDDPRSVAEQQIEFSLADVFPQFDSLDALASRLIDQSVELVNRNSELLGDILTKVEGTQIEPRVEKMAALDFYNQWLTACVGFLKNGDDLEFQPCIVRYEVDDSSKLYRFKLSVVPAFFANTLAKNIAGNLDLPRKLMRQVAHIDQAALPRVDFRKQLETFRNYLDNRIQTTGETELTITSKDYSFRHAVAYTPDGFNFPSAGTSNPSDKLLLPLFLESGGEFDLLQLSIQSDPLDIRDAVVRYTIAKPALNNVYHVSSKGLTPKHRQSLNQHQLQLYERIYDQLAHHLVFAGKQLLESNFADLATWLIKKITYCLEEPSFLTARVKKWLKEHEHDSYKQLEDNFFLPFIHEKMKDEFGDEIVIKPAQFAGEVDISFRLLIPVELKVREGHKTALVESAVDSKFPGEGQAAAYASVSRLGIVLVLDVPILGETETITNLDNCVRVAVRHFDGDDQLSTCVVGFVFHCHHPIPSSVE